MTKIYYWRGRPNFGDLLGPLLIKHFANLPTDWAPVADAELVCVGSVLDLLPSTWRGVIAGAGKLQETHRPDLRVARTYGVRGPLSALGIRGDYAIGDPGILADELVRPDKAHKLGIVPHWTDHDLEHRPEFKRYDPLIIDPLRDPLVVLAEIGSCHKIVSSSLHGIIAADAFGIPRRIEVSPIMTRREGGDFKFRDHNAAVGLRHEIGVTQEAPRYLVQDRQHEVFDMLVAVGAYFRGLART